MYTVKKTWLRSIKTTFASKPTFHEFFEFTRRCDFMSPGEEGVFLNILMQCDFRLEGLISFEVHCKNNEMCLS